MHGSMRGGWQGPLAEPVAYSPPLRAANFGIQDAAAPAVAMTPAREFTAIFRRQRWVRPSRDGSTSI